MIKKKSKVLAFLLAASIIVPSADGMVVYADNVSSVESAVNARANTTEVSSFKDLQKKVNEVQDGDIIKLADNIGADTTDNVLNVNNGKTFTIDTNGKTAYMKIKIDGTSNLTLTGGGKISEYLEQKEETANSASVIEVLTNATLNTNNVTIENKKADSLAGYGMIVYGNLNTSDGTVINSKTGIVFVFNPKAVIENTTINAVNNCITSNENQTRDEKMEITIKNGYFECKDTKDTGNLWNYNAIYWPSHGKLNIYGGTFKSYEKSIGGEDGSAALLVKNGIVNIYGGEFYAKDGIKIVDFSNTTEIYVNIYNTDLNGSKGLRSGIYVDEQGNLKEMNKYKVYIKGGNFEGTGKGAIYLKKDENNKIADINVTGGSFKGGSSIGDNKSKTLPTRVIDGSKFVATEKDGIYTVDIKIDDSNKEEKEAYEEYKENMATLEEGLNIEEGIEVNKDTIESLLPNEYFSVADVDANTGIAIIKYSRNINGKTLEKEFLVRINVVPKPSYPSYPSKPTYTHEKIEGLNRYETAAKIADKLGSYDNVVLVNAESSMSDGLSASGLAGKENGAILLTKKDSIPKATMDRLKKVKKVYIIGGENAISQKVYNEITKNVPNVKIERLGGKTRVETSEIVAKKLGNYNKAFVVNGFKGEADAMSVSSVAAKNGAPILLTNGKTSTHAKKSGVEYYVIGGDTVVDKSIATKYDAEVLAGKDRYATNKEVIDEFYSGRDKIYFANGETLVDALTASTLAKKDGIALVNAKSDKSVLKGKDTVQVGGMKFTIDFEK